jgi:excisionase family DNA binding protein
MNATPKLDRVMTIPEVAEYLKISKSKIYYLVNQRKIPHIRLQRNVRVFESDLQEWLKKQKEG